MKRIEKELSKAHSHHMSEVADSISKSNEEIGDFKTGRWTKGKLNLLPWKRFDLFKFLN